MPTEAVDQSGKAAESVDDAYAAPVFTAVSEDKRRDAFIRSRHRWVLVGVIAVLFAALVLEVVDGDRVALRGLPSYPLPHSCAARMFFDSGCPGCGLTRSFIYLAAGRWDDSLAVHRIGWLLAVAMLIQIPYRATGLLAENPAPLGTRIPAFFGYTLIFILFSNWVFELIR